MPAGCSCGLVFFFQAEDGIRDLTVTGVQTCALPISDSIVPNVPGLFTTKVLPCKSCTVSLLRSEEHTSELQSQSNLVCRLLLEKKKLAQSAQGTCGSRSSLWPGPHARVLGALAMPRI